MSEQPSPATTGPATTGPATTDPATPDPVTHPLDGVASIKVKLGLLVGASILVAVIVREIGSRAAIPGWLTIPVTIVAALAATQWLSRGMISPLREMTVAARDMAAGHYAGRVRATSTDEVGELARAFNTMAEDLAAVDRERRHLIATVSHELRTPLTAQRALLENLADGVVRPDDVALGRALAQAERLSDLVTDLLDLSRLEAGVTNLSVAPVSVADLLDGAVAEAALGGRDVAFTSSCLPADLGVEVDGARVAQLLANLLDNAARHSPTGGTVTVSASGLDAQRWALEVCDEGPGIDPADAERVFARFGTGADAGSGGGTGLGLAIARWVCELHGGTLATLPTDGRSGARLRAVLPRHTPSRPSQPTPPEVRMLPTPAPSPASPPASPASPASPALPALPALPAPPSGPSGPRVARPLVGAPEPLLDAIFGRLWPEREKQPQPRILLSSVAIGAFAATVLPWNNLGLGVLLVLLLAGGLVLSVTPHRWSRWTLVSAALCLGLASFTVLRAAEQVTVLAVAVAGALVATALTRATGLVPILASGAAWVLSGLRGLPLLGRTVTSLAKSRLLWPVLRTLALSFVALLVFGGLYASADALFGVWADRFVPDLDWANVTLRGFVAFVVGGVVLAGSYLALNPPAVERLRLPAGRPLPRLWEWLVPVGTVVAVFAAFLSAQGAAMWGGHEYLRRTTGLTYAAYVHQGFGQLTLATLLTLGVVGLALRKRPDASDRDRLVVRVSLAVLCVLALAVVGSALYRMSLYQEAYGYTVLRVFVDGFELWLGFVIVLALVAVIRLSWHGVARAALLGAAVLTLVFGAMNPDAWVAQRNVDRFVATGKVDVSYLASLSADAVPVYAASSLPPDVRPCLVRSWDGRSPDASLWGWNLGRARAAELSAATPAPADSLECSAVLSQGDYGGRSARN